jgi:hypothetical protein
VRADVFDGEELAVDIAQQHGNAVDDDAMRAARDDFGTFGDRA